MANVDFGNVPTWISGLGTTGALLINSILLRKAFKERGEMLEEKRRDQASLVTAWLDPDSRSIKIRNGSEAAIDNCFVFIDSRTGDKKEFDLVEYWVGAVPPKATNEVAPRTEQPRHWKLNGVQFQDSRGRLWTRDWMNGLQELTPTLADKKRWRRVRAWLAKVIPWLRPKPIELE
ncbi:hypothetical protein [Micromonospora sp. LH3U1]|uniref:hypothetical protein n=1 Tax=Micromonospora sp. LH3U1 TaxID=3018339 RepID=UPI00234BC192|nr:hypothetical protein [Micromonospora sp. LH3U1]WCN83165.1 hypothetical protein PCA76_08980 [Micromonospora sp. LH3U1]